MSRAAVSARLAAACLSAAVFFAPPGAAGNNPVPVMPEFFLDGRPAGVTVQELGGLASRPLRRLVARNNEARGDEFIQTYALGVRAGERLSAQVAVPAGGVRVTVYRIFRPRGGPRYLSMPSTVYFSEPGSGVFEETVEPFEEEALILVYERPRSPDAHSVQIRYFQEHVRKLVLASYKTNILFSSLKFKMKEFGEGGTGKFFERDAQTLIDRLDRPQRIFLLRLWRADRD